MHSTSVVSTLKKIHVFPDGIDINVIHIDYILMLTVTCYSLQSLVTIGKESSNQWRKL